VRDDDLTVGSLPPWFRRWGTGAWLVVGMALVVVAAVELLSLTSSIVGPLIAGAVIGAVGGVVVDALERRGWPRVAGAAVVTLTLAALTLLVVGLVLGAITSQASHIDALLSQAVDKVEGWLNSLGITSASDAAKDIKKAAPDIGRTFLKGVASGISGLKSLLVFLGFTVFTSFFLLKDGPAMGRWIERHMGMRPAEARIVTGDILLALRKYFLGLTIVGAFNTAIVTLGGADHLPGQRSAPAGRAANRVWRHPAAQPAGRVQRHDRGRHPVRNGGPDPRRATCVGGGPRPRSPRRAQGVAGRRGSRRRRPARFGRARAADRRRAVSLLKCRAASRASRGCAPRRSR
jgi:hypothetical protein